MNRRALSTEPYLWGQAATRRFKESLFPNPAILSRFKLQSHPEIRQSINQRRPTLWRFQGELSSRRDWLGE